MTAVIRCANLEGMIAHDRERLNLIASCHLISLRPLHWRLQAANAFIRQLSRDQWEGTGSEYQALISAFIPRLYVDVTVTGSLKGNKVYGHTTQGLQCVFHFKNKTRFQNGLLCTVVVFRFLVFYFNFVRFVWTIVDIDQNIHWSVKLHAAIKRLLHTRSRADSYIQSIQLYLHAFWTHSCCHTNHFQISR